MCLTQSLHCLLDKPTKNQWEAFAFILMHHFTTFQMLFELNEIVRFCMLLLSSSTNNLCIVHKKERKQCVKETEANRNQQNDSWHALHKISAAEASCLNDVVHDWCSTGNLSMMGDFITYIIYFQFWIQTNYLTSFAYSLNVHATLTLMFFLHAPLYDELIGSSCCCKEMCSQQ